MYLLSCSINNGNTVNKTTKLKDFKMTSFSPSFMLSTCPYDCPKPNQNRAGATAKTKWAYLINMKWTSSNWKQMNFYVMYNKSSFQALGNAKASRNYDVKDE